MNEINICVCFRMYKWHRIREKQKRDVKKCDANFTYTIIIFIL